MNFLGKSLFFGLQSHSYWIDSDIDNVCLLTIKTQNSCASKIINQELIFKIHFSKVLKDLLLAMKLLRFYIN